MTTKDLAPGSTLGRYELLVPIAAGGMARVWAARLRGRAGFSKIVALKMILPEHAGDIEFQEMFLDEARIASKLRHANACETLDLGEDRGVLFLTMEWVDGASLWRVLRASGRAEKLPPRLAAKIVADACAGLHAAHELADDDGTKLHVVHRDVSPQNLLLSEQGEVKVSDFGVAKALGKTHATQKGHVKGKLAYMAPEQLQNSPLDRRCDVFALGVVLYEATTGKRPFDGETDAAVLQAVLAGKYRAPRQHDAAYPERLEAIVERALAKERSARYASAAEMRAELEEWLAASGPAVRSEDIASLVRARCGVEIEKRREAIRDACKAPDPNAKTELAVTPKPEVKEASRGTVTGIAAALLLGSIGLGVWTMDREPRDLAAGETEAAPPPTTQSLPLNDASPGAPSPSTSRETEAGVPPRAIDMIALEIDPPDATVVLNGRALSPGVTAIPRPHGGMPGILVRAPGYRDEFFLVDESTPSPKVVKLIARPDAGP